MTAGALIGIAEGERPTNIIEDFGIGQFSRRRENAPRPSWPEIVTTS